MNPPLRSFRTKSRNKPRRPSRLFLDYARYERRRGIPDVRQNLHTLSVSPERVEARAGRDSRFDTLGTNDGADVEWRFFPIPHSPFLRSFRAKSRNQPRRRSRLFLDYARYERGAGMPDIRQNLQTRCPSVPGVSKGGQAGTAVSTRSARTTGRMWSGISSRSHTSPFVSSEAETSSADDHAYFSTTLDTNGERGIPDVRQNLHTLSVSPERIERREGRDSGFDTLGTNDGADVEWRLFPIPHLPPPFVSSEVEKPAPQTITPVSRLRSKRTGAGNTGRQASLRTSHPSVLCWSEGGQAGQGASTGSARTDFSASSCSGGRRRPPRRPCREFRSCDPAHHLLAGSGTKAGVSGRRAIMR